MTHIGQQPQILRHTIEALGMQRKSLLDHTNVRCTACSVSAHTHTHFFIHAIKYHTFNNHDSVMQQCLQLNTLDGLQAQPDYE